MDHPPYFTVYKTRSESPNQDDLGTATTITENNLQLLPDSRTDGGGQSSQAALVDEEKNTAAKPVYDPNDTGIRRIIRNFTPSYVSSAPGYLLNAEDVLRNKQMVHRHNGYGHSLYPTASITLQQPLARHHICHLLRSQHLPLRWLLHHLHLPVRHVSRVMGRHDAALAAKSVLGNNGAGNTH